MEKRDFCFVATEGAKKAGGVADPVNPHGSPRGKPQDASRGYIATNTACNCVYIVGFLFRKIAVIRSLAKY